MHQPSDEQQAVLDHVRAGRNVIVEACAGSGKSTTILSLARELAGLRFLQFTYNKQLRLEIKEKVETLRLKNLDVHTFHSFSVKHYTDEASVDTGIRHLLLDDMPCRTPLPAYDVVVLDECQDMTPLFFQLVVKVLRDLLLDSGRGSAGARRQIQMVVLGDARQCLYEFKGADSRFLTFADRVWSRRFGLGPFERCTLRTSYRITQPMAWFVNRALLGTDLMVASRDGPQVTYIRRPKYQIEDIIIYRIDHFMKKGDLPSDIFVLAHSVKSSNHHIARLANKLVEKGIPVHIPAFETDEVEDCVIEGKVVFSTFHTAKGRERKHVFLPGFDQSYFSFAPDYEKRKCPNTLYVGCTRATQNLILCEYDSSCPLDFLQLNHHQLKQSGHVNFQGLPQTNFFPQDDFSNGGPSVAPEIVTRDVSPTKLTKFVQDAVLDELTPLLERMFVVEQEPAVGAPDLPRMIRTKMGLYEDVSDLNGIAIPAFYFDHLFKRSVVGGGGGNLGSVGGGGNHHLGTVGSLAGNLGPGETALRGILSNKTLKWQQKNEHVFLQQAIAKLPPQCKTVADYLYLANVSVCAQEEIYFKLKQIADDEYTWLSEEMMQQCMATLDRHLGTSASASEAGSSEAQAQAGTSASASEAGTSASASEAGTSEAQAQAGTSAREALRVEHVLVDKTNDMEMQRRRIDEALFPHFGHELRFKFVARADVVTSDTLWELKCVNKLTIDHMMQTAIYAWLQRVTADPDEAEKGCKILNVRTGEVRRLEASLEELTRVVVFLLRNKFSKTTRLTDDDFLVSTAAMQ